MKQGTLFCFLCHAKISQTTTLSCHALGIFGKLLTRRGALTWFETIWSYGVEAIDY